MSTNPKVAGLEGLAAQGGKNAPSGLAGAGLGGDGGVSVDKIRDILFGNQMQDYDKRFSALEERFNQKLKDVEAEHTRSLASLEASMKKHVDSLASQLREEKEVRADANKELERSLREHTQALDKRISQLSDQLAQLEREVSDRSAKDSQGLRDEIKRRNDDTRATIERMFSELSNVKTDRNLLAGLFVEIAKCLNQDLVPKAHGAKGVDLERS